MNSTNSMNSMNITNLTNLMNSMNFINFQLKIKQGEQNYPPYYLIFFSSSYFNANFTTSLNASILL